MLDDIDHLLDDAIALHEERKFFLASVKYRNILKQDASHADTNHNFGLLKVEMGLKEEALIFLQTAINTNPNVLQYWITFINTLTNVGRFDDAGSVLEQAHLIGHKDKTLNHLRHNLDLAQGKYETLIKPNKLDASRTMNAEANYESSVKAEQKTSMSSQANSYVQYSDKSQTNILDTMKLDKALKLAKKKIIEGLSKEAKNIYQDILVKFPKNKRAMDGLKGLAGVLIGSDKMSKAQDPPYGQQQSIINLYSRGKLKKSLQQARMVLQQFPNSSFLYYFCGAAHKGLDQLDAAVEAYKKAIYIKPNYAEAYYNMGVILQNQGKLEEATEAYHRVLIIKPDYAKAYNNMGIILKNQGKLEEALEACKNAFSINPGYAEAYYNVGKIFKDQGKLGEAIAAYHKALSIKPDLTAAHKNLGRVLQGIIFNKPDRDLQKTIITLLDRKISVRPKDIVGAAISLLKLEPTLQKHLKLLDDEVIESPLDVISDINEFPLLLKLMSVCPLPDLELEKLLKNLRRSILSHISSPKEASPGLLRFQSALALQCFTNEYIYNDTVEEEKILQSLDYSIKKALKNKEQPNPQVILALASYKALNQYDWCNLLVVTDDIKEIFIRHVEEPNGEEKLKQDLPILEEITDSISSEVRAQYEESPYPRWVNLRVPLKPFLISNVIDQIKLKVHNNKIIEVETPDILIAGCGTGQHSIETAARFKGSKVLAIDLSLSSLAYAKRKTDELGIDNLEYMQADILDLGKLNKQFDIIESAGVLHHMDNPMAGWKILTDCLKPGGLMTIGLYSELARQDIVKIREEISNAGIGSSDAEMKSFRNTIMGSNKFLTKQILTSTDFYSLSGFRDLLFHVQEHRFTIPQIKVHLKKLGLEFCGFDTSSFSHFKQINKHKEDLYDLNKWQAYEEANQTAFAGMYQFWCQKVDGD